MLGEHPFDHLDEQREVVCDDIPELAKINTVVRVNQHVSETADAPPRDLRVLQPHFVGHALGSFADDFEVSDDRVNDQVA